MNRYNQYSQQACGGFSQNTLMGNWMEERLAPKQPFRDITLKKLRETDNAISTYVDNGTLLPLRRLERNSAWQTKENIPNDNYKEFRTTNQTFFDKKLLNNYFENGDCRNITKTIQEKKDMPEINTITMMTHKSNSYHLVGRHNIKQLEKERTAKQNIGDFGSTLRKHDEMHSRFLDMTSYQQSFSRPLKQTPNDMQSKQQKEQNQPAGLSIQASKPPDQQRKRLLSLQTGEKFQEEQDPKYNTTYQRSWVPIKNTGLQEAKQNLQRDRTKNFSVGISSTVGLETYLKNVSQRQSVDNATSLPIGDGEFSQNAKRQNTPGEFRRIRSDITRVMNTSLSKR
ncbi:hypothetical protein TTHERM_00984980 (macronuclear) [Tetrahymena thermophila SB210]|uniref:Uncharacterized protein n=1 Tax=Tetrahymena thermophila (strain SB210) TaxID=312017 RepID=Q233Y0_TETTS|nr:hypothetical protein TTHERM_00984980 [Tetrahymena thermophila SB210]EAR91804.1 hypothetical protein TTHERM_00984980 [Tetrahymena thermophila SB210]|eukprot:XP_001012049.1 hypothetical protein TTHERM_00984980 [Tetrahymena thermophila SB210]